MSAVKMDKKIFSESIAQSDRPVLVEFWAPWCVYCRRIASALDKVAEQQEGKVLAGQINIDEEADLAAEYNIDVIPTLIIFKNGHPAASVIAPGSKAEIDAFINANI